jgi:hypothetical protein
MLSYEDLLELAVELYNDCANEGIGEKGCDQMISLINSGASSSSFLYRLPEKYLHLIERRSREERSN